MHGNCKKHEQQILSGGIGSLTSYDGHGVFEVRNIKEALDGEGRTLFRIDFLDEYQGVYEGQKCRSCGEEEDGVVAPPITQTEADQRTDGSRNDDHGLQDRYSSDSMFRICDGHHVADGCGDHCYFA